MDVHPECRERVVRTAAAGAVLGGAAPLAGALDAIARILPAAVTQVACTLPRSLGRYGALNVGSTSSQQHRELATVAMLDARGSCHGMLEGQSKYHSVAVVISPMSPRLG